MKPTSEFPEDPALAAIAAIRDGRIAGVSLGALCGYTRGSRATFEGRLGERRVAIKVYAGDPAPEAALYEALGAAGLSGASGPRVPALLAWDRELRVMVIGWLEGRTAQELVCAGQGERAGALAADWIRRVSSMRVGLGPSHGTAGVLERIQEWIAALWAAAPDLGRRATVLADRLLRAQPRESAPRLVHGTLYDRHILDLGDGPGVIDWQRFGQGPLELDGGMFLATLARLRLAHVSIAAAAASAEAAFLANTADLLEPHALAWHCAAGLLHLGRRRLHRRAPEECGVLLDEAARHTRTL